MLSPISQQAALHFGISASLNEMWRACCPVSMHPVLQLHQNTYQLSKLALVLGFFWYVRLFYALPLQHPAYHHGVCKAVTQLLSCTIVVAARCPFPRMAMPLAKREDRLCLHVFVKICAWSKINL